MSSAILVAIPRDAIGQQEGAGADIDPTITNEQLQTRITEIQANHPIYSTLIQEIPNLDLNETVKGYLAAGVVQNMFKFHAKNVVEERVANATGAEVSSPLEEMATDEQIQAKATEIQTKHPKFAAVVETISNLDLQETWKAYLGAEVLQKLYKYHAKNLVQEQVANATQQ